MIKTHSSKKTKLRDNFFFFTLNLKKNGATNRFGLVCQKRFFRLLLTLVKIYRKAFSRISDLGSDSDTRKKQSKNACLSMLSWRLQL